MSLFKVFDQSYIGIGSIEKARFPKILSHPSSYAEENNIDFKLNMFL